MRKMTYPEAVLLGYAQAAQDMMADATMMEAPRAMPAEGMDRPMPREGGRREGGRGRGREEGKRGDRERGGRGREEGKRGDRAREDRKERGDRDGKRGDRDMPEMPPAEMFWKQVSDQAKGMRMDEFKAGWRQIDQEAPDEHIEKVFNSHDWN